MLRGARQLSDRIRVAVLSSCFRAAAAALRARVFSLKQQQATTANLIGKFPCQCSSGTRSSGRRKGLPLIYEDPGFGIHVCPCPGAPASCIRAHELARPAAHATYYLL